MLYYLRLREEKGAGGPVVVCCRIGDKRKYITLPIRLEKRDWEPAPVGAVRATSPALRVKAEELRAHLKRADNYLADIKYKGAAFVFDAFRAAVLDKLPAATVGNGYGLRLACMDYLAKNELSYVVRSLYLRVTTWAEKLHPGITVPEIDFSFLGNFWLYALKQGNNKNSANKKIQCLKTLVSWGEKCGWPVASSRNFFKLKEQQSEKNFLSLEDIAELEKLLFAGGLAGGEKKLAAGFLFACLTGLRFAEVTRLSRNLGAINGHGLALEVKGGKTLYVPISARARRIVDEGLLLPFYTNQKANSALPVLLEKVGVKRKISFHCARHSFAVCSLRLGVKVEVLQTLLGHSKISTTMIYARIVDNLKEEAVSLWDK